ncbi:MAG TPA: DUF4388 domain-containing protein [Thermoanaerobaculia bacterium]|nr:DUF4388 domain-containing protein [Thermoanaerobaculia bacterium]HUM28906.1 DUF4388 domain-containing protein [Thermoanaerobaculia bacterium]HXK67161.1 DUF4388 domain-containing protein [Thermoanaerobaculia bacterium]
MAFQGSLKEIPLPDIIQLVSVSGKTGVFILEKGEERGEIYLREGQIVHAVYLALEGEEAIYALSIWPEGDFHFQPGVEPEKTTIQKSNTNLLMEAARRLDEWRILRKKIPSEDLVPHLIYRPNWQKEVILSPYEWSVVTQMDGVKSIGEVSKVLNWSTFDVAKILYGLITQQLVELKPKEETP